MQLPPGPDSVRDTRRERLCPHVPSAHDGAPGCASLSWEGELGEGLTVLELGAGQLLPQCSASDAPHPSPLPGRRGRDSVPARKPLTAPEDAIQAVAATLRAGGPPQKSNFTWS